MTKKLCVHIALMPEMRNAYNIFKILKREVHLRDLDVDEMMQLECVLRKQAVMTSTGTVWLRTGFNDNLLWAMQKSSGFIKEGTFLDWLRPHDRVGVTRNTDMVFESAASEAKNECAGEGQQQFTGNIDRLAGCPWHWQEISCSMAFVSNFNGELICLYWHTTFHSRRAFLIVMLRTQAIPVNTIIIET
jgi:hypothetical protein